MKRIIAQNKLLGIPGSYSASRNLPIQMEARKLVSIGSDIYQRDQQMIPAAALAWQSMRQSAEADSITLQVVSAYRSVDYQLGIITRKLEKGLGIDEILRVSAAPGFSEHHSGRAIDITMPDYPVLEEEFELSEAFSWLTQFAADFDFQMSFPRNNPHSVAYEPWHWAWRA